MIDARHLRTLLRLCVVACLVSFTACETSPKPAGKAEPGYVALRNSTGQDVRSMQVAGQRNDPMQPTRMGSISPLPRNQTVVFTRRKNAPRVPVDAVVKWETPDGRAHQIVLDTSHLASQVQGAPGEAIVFEVFAGNRAACYIDIVPEAAPLP